MSRADAPRPRPLTPGTRLRSLARWWWAAAILLLVGASALVPLEPIRDAATGGPVPEATLRLPAAYVIAAPASNLLDTLTLLSLRQHLALLATLALLFALWFWRRGRVVPAGLTPGRRAIRHAARAGLALTALLAVYVVALLVPRPMAALQLSPDIVALDFHAHTQYSHDGRWHWSPADVRDWHRDAGYSAAYVSDHRTFEGAREGWAGNPRLNGEGTVLLPALEVVWKGEHVNVLDADRTYSGLFNATLRDVDDDAFRLASLIVGKEPVAIETLPGDLAHVNAAAGRGAAGVRAIELIDGSPKGLGQTRRERQRIVHLADSLNLALVSGSDSHGWGYAAQGWTLMVLPQWRAANPAQLDDAINTTLRAAGSRGTRVVERWVADTDDGVRLPFTVPIVLWGMLRTLSGDERVMWIAWTLLAAALLAYRARRRPASPAA